MSGLRPSQGARLAAFAASAALIFAMAPASAAGPEVGDSVPAFEAVDHAGRTQNLASLAGERGLLLLFFRSADW